MIRSFSPMIASLAVCYLAACNGYAASEFSCPVAAGPKEIVSEYPPRKGDRILLADPKYFELMIRHGSDDDLRALIMRAESQENYAYTNKTLVQKVKDNLQARSDAGCPEVPSYNPEDHYLIQPIMGNMIK